MANPFSKQVLDRSTGTDKILASTSTHGATAAAALTAELSARLKPGEVMPDFGLVLALLGRHLDHRRLAMNAADDVHQGELSDDDAPRSARDETNARLGARLVATREAVRALFGAAGEKAVGFDGTTPVSPRPRIKLARIVADRLGRLGVPLVEGFRFDAEPIAQSLRTDADTLEGHVGEVEVEVREAEGTQLEKDAQMTAYDRAFAGSAAVIAGLYRLAGKGGLADRLRPASRRPGITAEDAGEAEPEAEA